MFGVKTGNAFLQHATYRMEGAKDDDSISGVRCGDGCAQCRKGGRMHACRHFPVPRQSLPCRLQGAPRCRPRRGQIVGRFVVLEPIGAGAIGLAIARELARAGWQVIIAEQTGGGSQ